MDYELELTQQSKKIDPLNNPEINITLKDHQLAIINKCGEIEKNNICGLGIMSDKPGTGKTYAIIGLIYHSQKKNNIIIVPQNIINQWAESIHNFSNGIIKYKKITEYSDILDIYNPKNTLFENDIILTTSLYYNVIATTMKGTSHIPERVFFDEIDSISSFVINEINARFIWFVSASFSYDELGIYTKKIDKELIPYITCKCNDKFIDNIFNIDQPNIYRIICKNIYVDYILQGILTRDEFRVLNAMDYSKIKKKFCNKVARNEKEAIEFLVKDKIDIMEMEQLRIDDLKRAIGNSGFTQRTELLKEELKNAQESYDDSSKKLELIRERLKENNFCPLCYNEFESNKNKAISPCCKNIICTTCTTNWFETMKKTNCIYCNTEDIKFEDYVILNTNISENSCSLCNNDYNCENDKYYASCCKKNACKECIKDWFHKLLKECCLFCNKEEILFEDFKNNKEYEEMKLNIQCGVKYTKKSKLEFIEYFIRTKIYANCKVIFCSSFLQIFYNMKNILEKHHINYLELDDGNIGAIAKSINSYKYGNVNVLLMNSNLFGCGLNLECTSDIVFLHKTEEQLEKQIIGRAQRLGRKNKLNIWHIIHENEVIFSKKKIHIKNEEGFNFFNENNDSEISGYNSSIIYEEINNIENND